MTIHVKSLSILTCYILVLFLIACSIYIFKWTKFYLCIYVHKQILEKFSVCKCLSMFPRSSKDNLGIQKTLLCTSLPFTSSVTTTLSFFLLVSTSWLCSLKCDLDSGSLRLLHYFNYFLAWLFFTDVVSPLFPIHGARTWLKQLI